MTENRIFTLCRICLQTDGHGETSIPLYNFVAGGITNIKSNEIFYLAHQQSTQCVSSCYGSLFHITINIKKLSSITEFIGTLEVNINHSSCMGQTLEIVINSYQSRPESVVRNTLCGLLMCKIKIFSHINCDDWRPTEGLLQKAHSATHKNLTSRY
jgi:hypothetical protein